MDRKDDTFEIDIAQKLNLWTINYLLYGAPADRKQIYKSGEEPYILINSATEKNLPTTAQKFLETHLKISRKEWLDSRGFTDVMLKRNNSSTGSAVIKEFVKEWVGRPISELYDINEELMETWTQPNFRKYIRYILPTKDDNYVNRVPVKFVNVFSKSNTKNVYLNEDEKTILRILSELVDDESLEEKKINSIILTWLLLLALLHSEIAKLDGFYKFKNEYSDIVEEYKYEISENHFSISNSTDYIKEGKTKNIRFYKTRELLNMGWDYITTAETLVWNDKLLYKIPEGDPSEGDSKLWGSFIRSRPETFGFLVSHPDNHIVGNYSICGLDKCKESIIEAGELFEGELTLDRSSTVSLFKPGEYILLILNISCNIGESTVRNNQMLINGLLEQLVEYAKNGVYFNKVYTTVFLDEQEALYEELGFKYIRDNIDIGQTRPGHIFRLDNFPFGLDWDSEQKSNLISEYQARK